MREMLEEQRGIGDLEMHSFRINLCLDTKINKHNDSDKHQHITDEPFCIIAQTLYLKTTTILTKTKQKAFKDRQFGIFLRVSGIKNMHVFGLINTNCIIIIH